MCSCSAVPLYPFFRMGLACSTKEPPVVGVAAAVCLFWCHTGSFLYSFRMKSSVRKREGGIDSRHESASLLLPFSSPSSDSFLQRIFLLPFSSISSALIDLALAFLPHVTAPSPPLSLKFCSCDVFARCVPWCPSFIQVSLISELQSRFWVPKFLIT